MELIAVRHGEAGKKLRNGDSGRSLTESGRADASRLGKLLSKLHKDADTVISSSLKRAVETADIIAGEMGLMSSRAVWRELNPESTAFAFLERLSGLDSDTTAIAVGHNPFLHELLAALLSDGECRIWPKKCGAARVSIDSFEPRPTGELVWLLTPKLERYAVDE